MGKILSIFDSSHPVLVAIGIIYILIIIPIIIKIVYDVFTSDSATKKQKLVFLLAFGLPMLMIFSTIIFAIVYF